MHLGSFYNDIQTKWKEPQMSGREMEEGMKSFLREGKDKASSRI